MKRLAAFVRGGFHVRRNRRVLMSGSRAPARKLLWICKLRPMDAP
jgi:hypothetical protein